MKRIFHEADLRAAERDGLCPTDAAERFGVSRATVHRAELAFGSKLPRRTRGDSRPNDYRAVAESMAPLDAVDYLLEVIETLRKPVPIVWQIPGVQLTNSERKLIYAMAAQKHVLGRDVALSALMFGREGDDEPEQKTLDVFVFRLRRKLAPLGIVITTHWGQGWTIQVPEGFVWPWLEA